MPKFGHHNFHGICLKAFPIPTCIWYRHELYFTEMNVDFTQNLTNQQKANSGISTMVVIPPAAAALVAVVYPSQLVLPGSFT